MGFVLPVAESGQVAVGAALAGVLGRGLAVHLQHAAAGAPEHAAQQVQVVHPARRRGRLVGLVEALEHRREDAGGRAEGRCGAPDVVRRHLADGGRDLGRGVLDDAAQLVEADGVRADPVVVDPAVREQLVGETVHQGEVRPGPHGQVHPAGADRLGGDGGAAWVDHDQRRRGVPVHPVEHARPEHGLRLGHVVPEQEQRVAVVDVGVGAGLAVGAERLLERGRARGRAEAGVAVHVRRADARLADGGERPVLLEGQLARGVEAVRERSPLVEQRARALDDAGHRRVPVGLDELAPLADERVPETVGVLLPDPLAVEALRPEPPVVDAVVGTPADADQPAVADGQVARAPVAAQGARRAHPGDVVLVHPVGEVLVDAHRPRRAARVRRPRAPGVRDPVQPDLLLVRGHRRGLPRTAEVMRQPRCSAHPYAATASPQPTARTWLARVHSRA